MRITASDWAAAFAAIGPGTPHNEARDTIWDELCEIVIAKHYEDVPTDELRSALERDAELRSVLHRAWPTLSPTDIVADLWSVPAYLRHCAPWLNSEEQRLLRRAPAAAWTYADVPILDAAHQRLGDAGMVDRHRGDAAERAAEREYMSDVVAEVLAADDDGEGAVTMLVGEDLREALVDEQQRRRDDLEILAGPFAHVVVDEAQELTDAQWQMLLRRCPSRSFTIVGDRAQARHGFTESWIDRLASVGLDKVTMTALSINYRTPVAVMAAAERVIRAVIPDANVPTSIRDNGLDVRYGSRQQMLTIVDSWLDENTEGTVCVIGDSTYPDRERVRSLTPELAKGLEFDLVVVVNPHDFGDGVTGAVDRYVAMTRTTQQLVVLTND